MTDKVLLDRRCLVQTLLASARTLKVEPVRDGAARSQVEGMMALIREAKLPKKKQQKKDTEEAKQQAEVAFTKYLASFATGAGARPEQQQPEQPRCPNVHMSPQKVPAHMHLTDTLMSQHRTSKTLCVSNVCVFFLFFNHMPRLQPLRRCQGPQGAPYAAAQAQQAPQTCLTSSRRRPKKGHTKAPRTEQNPLCVGPFRTFVLEKLTHKHWTHKGFWAPLRPPRTEQNPLCVGPFYIFCRKS